MTQRTVSSAEGPDHILIEHVSKSFGATRALADVSVRIRRGAIHSFVGENGAGKSTLGKIIAGVHLPDSGTVSESGQVVTFRSPRDALARGVTMVAQELSLIPARSVIDNIFLGQEPCVGPIVRKRELRKRFDQLIQNSGITVPPDVAVGALSIADQQKVEILRALAREASLIIMDEPTARLTSEEKQALLQIIRDLAAQGTTVVFVSHFLDDVLAVSDTISILRDGGLVRTGPAAEETNRSLVEAMVGRSIDATYPEKRIIEDRREVLEVAGLTRFDGAPAISFSVAAGEIVGLAGLVGSGRSGILRAIYGDDTPLSGSVLIDGEPQHLRSPYAAIGAGIGLIPESRKDQGLLLSQAVRNNVSLPHLDRLRTAGLLGKAAETAAVSDAIDQVDLRGAGIDDATSALSGGNQQKVLFARWLIDPPRRLLLADEPTRGVDVGAKRAIYDLLVQAAADGLAVLFVSSELEEIVGLAHRVLIIRDHGIAAELSGDDITETAILSEVFATTTQGSPS